MARKRGNGEGTIAWSESLGLYRAALSVNGKRKWLSGKTREDVAEKLTEELHNRHTGLPSPSAERLDGFLQWWLGTVEAKAAAEQKSVNTVDNARWAVEKWVNPNLGSKRLRDLEPEDVETLLNTMAALGRSQSTVNRVKMVLGEALAVAERRNKVARNVARIAEMPATKKTKEKRALTAEEARSFLQSIQGHRLEALFMMAVMLGLRPGELLGLRWEDIDPDGSLEISGSLKRERGELRLGDTKTDGSKRGLDLPAAVTSALRAHRKCQLEDRMRVGRAWVDMGLVFATTVGTPIDPSNLRRETKKLTALAGVPEMCPNELGRHRAANLLYDSGMPLERIADLLGHESTRMLAKHYRHRGRQAFSAHIAPMEQIFATD